MILVDKPSVTAHDRRRSQFGLTDLLEYGKNDVDDSYAFTKNVADSFINARQSSSPVVSHSRTV